MLNASPRVALLEQTSPEYNYYYDTWRTIRDIREGAVTIMKKIRSYLPKRPGEAEDLYRLRLAKASWTPVMTTAIREFVVKMLASPIHIEGIEADFWERFKDDTNGKGRDESDLLTQMFSCMLYYGRVYVAIDRATLQVQPRSLLEERLSNALPKVAIFEPLDVINKGDGWYITKEVNILTQPLELPKTQVTWRVWDSMSIYTYSAEVQLDGVSIKAVKIGNDFVPVGSPLATAKMVSKIDHQMGKVPIVESVLQDELWTGNNCYLKQLQHFAIESSWTDAGIMAGTIQRVFTPTPPVRNDNPAYIEDEPDYSDLKADNQHVLIGNGFQFVESSGSAIASLTSQLETITNQIRAIVSMSSNTVDASVQAQSGTSKAIDREPLEATLKAYGQKVASLYQDVLQLVAVAASQDASIIVNGLDSYSVDTLDDMLAQSLQLGKLLTALPPTALKLWYGKLSNLIAGSRSAMLDNQINDELDQIWKDGLPVSLLPPEPENDNIVE